jgi:hypothetical protein
MTKESFVNNPSLVRTSVLACTMASVQGLECRHAPGVMGIVAVYQHHQRASVTERHKCPAFRFAST